jgi:hypothetical protein
MSQTDDSVAKMLFVDAGVRSLLLGEARRRAVTRMVGIPAEDQSLLVTMIVLGAAGTVVHGCAPRLPPSLIRPGARDTPRAPGQGGQALSALSSSP